MGLRAPMTCGRSSPPAHAECGTFQRSNCFVAPPRKNRPRMCGRWAFAQGPGRPTVTTNPTCVTIVAGADRVRDEAARQRVEPLRVVDEQQRLLAPHAGELLAQGGVIRDDDLLRPGAQGVLEGMDLEALVSSVLAYQTPL